jgi:hypothetical protein
MPIQIYDKDYTGIFGSSLTYYKSNAGDKTTLDLLLHASIRITSLTNPLFLDPSINQITSSSLSWIIEGFRAGDTVECTTYQSSGTIVDAWTTTVNYVDDTNIVLGTILGWIDLANGDFFVITVTTRQRATLEVLLNHCTNSSAGMPFSLIDGESTRIKFDETDLMAVSDVITGINIVNQSGQFLMSAALTRQSDYDTGVYVYKLTLEYVNSGVYDPSWFDTADCLKTFVQLEWASLAGEPYAKTISILSDSADTGYFDQPFNTGVVDAVLVQGIDEIDYANPSTFDVTIDSASTDIAIGCVYISTDTAYYKNRQFSQNEIAMILPSSIFTFGVPIDSYLNEFGSGYSITINSITTVGTINTINLTFTPNTDFTSFMEAREDGDRNMKLWVKIGNLNLLIFDDQVTKEPPVGGPLIPEQNIFIDHSDNTTESSLSALGYEANTEDDLAFCGKFLLERNALYESITYNIEAFNTSTLEDFTLNSCYFNIGSVPMVGGTYILNQTQTVQNTLPSTSEKRVASLILDPSIDTLTHYGIKVYFPFLLRWEYWLQQINANADFYPNYQTKNWVPYGNTGDWQIRLKIELVKDGLSYVFTDEIIDKDYDSDPNINQNIELFIDSTGQNVQVVTEGMLMRVIGYHNLVSGFWDYPNLWGQITVEPTESNPRFISSTHIDYDNNPSNPLIPLTGETKCKMTLTSPTTIELECYFNPDLIDLSNGVKFTTKIKGCKSETSPFGKITTDDIEKLTTDNQQKIIA